MITTQNVEINITNNEICLSKKIQFNLIYAYIILIIVTIILYVHGKQHNIDITLIRLIKLLIIDNLNPA